MQKFQWYKKLLFWFFSEGLGKKNVEEVYAALSSNDVYDDVIDYQKRLANLKTAVSVLEGKHTKALDLACGTGVFIEAINPECFEKIVGVDLSQGMLDVAKKRFSSCKNISFIKSSFMDVSFGKGEFDLILMANASRFIAKDREDEFFSTVAGWLDNNGVFLIQGDYVISDRFMKFYAPIVGKILNKRNLNFKTIWALELKQVLSKHFDIYKEIELSNKANKISNIVKHRIYFCRKKVT